MEEGDLSELMRSVGKKSLQMLEFVKFKPEETPEIIHRYMDLTRDFMALSGTLLKNPEQVWKMQTAYWRDAMSLAQEQFQSWMQGKITPVEDKRFSSEEWVNNPFFSLLSQQYLLASEHVHCMLEHLDYGDKHLAKRVKFFSRQFLDALSPSNFLQTNPQLMAETLKSHGKNLLRGLYNLLTDMDSGSSRLLIKMTDTEAFQVGKNIAVTPGKVVFRNDMMELIQYSPVTEKVNSIPLLVIPPWINKYYILDLSKNNSFIGWLVEQGITVFVISWVNPDASYAEKGLFDYLQDGPMKALDVISLQLKVEKINTLGFCIGGTLQACLLSYLAAHQNTQINSATFLASMIDFSDPGDIEVFIDEHQIRRIEEQMKAKGYLEGHFMASTFNSLRANDLVWSFFVKNYLQGQTPVPFDILFWNSDTTNMPAKMHSQYLRWMYLHNNLIKPGKIKLNHTPLDVGKINVPTYFVSTRKDHIAPWKTTYKGYLQMQAPSQFMLAGSGHIAGIVNPVLTSKYGYYTNSIKTESPDEWLKSAKCHEGSWWPEWCKWLKKHSGKLIPAPVMEKLPYKALEDAPGSYVMMMAEKSQTK